MLWYFSLVCQSPGRGRRVPSYGGHLGGRQYNPRREGALGRVEGILQCLGSGQRGTMVACDEEDMDAEQVGCGGKVEGKWTERGI